MSDSTYKAIVVFGVIALAIIAIAALIAAEDDCRNRGGHIRETDCYWRWDPNLEQQVRTCQYSCVRDGDQ